ncbi:ATP-binding protein, partial [Parvimonas sp. M13]|uniref:ATP-binding protein n=1 Tax=Parvimonas sp. M13 TaxID=3110694 RepID=UPI002B492F30
RRIERTRALAVRLFGANQPVDNPRDLFGREAELRTLREAVLESGMHADIHGPRGSGKTSLVRVFGDMADARGATIIYLSC